MAKRNRSEAAKKAWETRRVRAWEREAKAEEISFEEFLAGIPKARGEALAAVAVSEGSNDFGPGLLARVEREEGSDAAGFLAGLREGIDF